jgi:hypothetical protein
MFKPPCGLQGIARAWQFGDELLAAWANVQAALRLATDRLGTAIWRRIISCLGQCSNRLAACKGSPGHGSLATNY